MGPIDKLLFLVFLNGRKDRFEVFLKSHNHFHDIVIIKSLFKAFDLFLKYLFHVRFVVFPFMLPVIEIFKIPPKLIMKVLTFLEVCELFFEKIQ